MSVGLYNEGMRHYHSLHITHWMLRLLLMGMRLLWLKLISAKAGKGCKQGWRHWAISISIYQNQTASLLFYFRGTLMPRLSMKPVAHLALATTRRRKNVWFFVHGVHTKSHDTANHCVSCFLLNINRHNFIYMAGWRTEPLDLSSGARPSLWAASTLRSKRPGGRLPNIWRAYSVLKQIKWKPFSPGTYVKFVFCL